jgi:signal transduction histidine kinase
MKQVLSNLLSNAIKFTPEGGNIRLSAMLSQRYLELGVADTGQGIPHKDLEQIFGKFNRASNNKRSGTGLGLSLVKQYTELHGGNVSITSEPGKGTLVTIFLPLEGKTQ